MSQFPTLTDNSAPSTPGPNPNPPDSPAATPVLAPPPPLPSPEKRVEIPFVVAELYPSAVIVQDKTVSKPISYDSFIEILKGARDSNDGARDDVGFWFPPNVYTFSKSKDRIQIGMYYPEHVEPLNYRGTSRPTVLPNIILSITLTRSGTEWKVVDSRYYCTKYQLSEMMRRDFVTGQGNGIWGLPFTNIYNDCRMCFGNAHKISTFTLPDLRGLHSYYRIIIDSEFNNDLGLYSLSDGSGFKHEYSKWFSHLAALAKANKPFPYDQLR